LAGASCTLTPSHTQTHTHTHTHIYILICIDGHKHGVHLCAAWSLFVGFVIIVGSLLGATLTRQQAFAALLLFLFHRHRHILRASVQVSLCVCVCVCVCGSKRFSHYANFVTNFCDLFFATNSSRSSLLLHYVFATYTSVCRATKIASVGTFWPKKHPSLPQLRVYSSLAWQQPNPFYAFDFLTPHVLLFLWLVSHHCCCCCCCCSCCCRVS